MVIAVFLFQLGYNWLMLPLLLASLIWLFYAIWKIGKWHDERLTLRLPVAKLWGLATGGPQIILNEESFDCLATIYGKDECREILQRSWGIQGESEVEPMLSWLFQEGHSAECLSILENERRDLVIESEDPQGRIQFALDHRDQFQQHGLAAWDCGRIVAVAKWSCCAGYLSEGKAWEWIARSSQRIQCEYSSWAEFGEHWILGFRYWSDGKETDSDWTKAIDWLLKSKKSPWLNLAWDTELS